MPDFCYLCVFTFFVAVQCTDTTPCRLPPIGDLVLGRTVYASSTCGREGPETYCDQMTDDQCQTCDASVPAQRHTPDMLTDQQSGRAQGDWTWWQSKNGVEEVSCRFLILSRTSPVLYSCLHDITSMCGISKKSNPVHCLSKRPFIFHAILGTCRTFTIQMFDQMAVLINLESCRIFSASFFLFCTYTKVELRLDFGAVFHLSHVTLTWKSERPRCMVIERSIDFGRTWHTYQYFALNCQECFGVRETFGAVPLEERGSSTVFPLGCTTSYAPDSLTTNNEVG